MTGHCSQENDRPAAEIHSVNRFERRGTSNSVRSELVAQASANGVDIGVDRRREAKVFPLCPHEQATNQIDVDAETCGVAIYQMIMLGLRGAQGGAECNGTGSYSVCKSKRIVIVDSGGTRDIGI